MSETDNHNIFTTLSPQSFEQKDYSQLINPMDENNPSNQSNHMRKFNYESAEQTATNMYDQQTQRTDKEQQKPFSDIGDQSVYKVEMSTGVYPDTSYMTENYHTEKTYDYMYSAKEDPPVNVNAPLPQLQHHQPSTNPESNNHPLSKYQPSQPILTCLDSLSWSVRKIYYRNFFNRLITFYIYSLKEEQRKIRETKQIEIKLLKQQNWPFKELFYKKYRNPNEEILFEFVNLCAEKIQANFKAYITAKRHKLALNKINRFKQKLCAVVKGWKTWNIYNCKKIQQIRKSFTQTSQQIDQEIQNPNIDRFKKMKKIEYLNSSQEVLRESFKKFYTHLYDSGAWIYEVEKCFKMPKIVKKMNQKIARQNYHQPQITSAEQANNFPTQQQPLSKQPQRKGRQRQFKQKPSTNQPKTMKRTKTQTIASSDSNLIQQQIIQNNSSFNTNYQTSNKSQQRPIVAKGKYQFTEEDIKFNENQFLKSQTNHQKSQNTDKNLKQDNQPPKINKFRDQEKKKLNKRQKYDPRKAIEQQKKRLQEQKKLKLEKQKSTSQNIPQKQQNPSKKTNKPTAQAPKKTPRKTKRQQQPNCERQRSPSSSKQKTVQKVKKQNKLTKKGDNSKSIKSIINHKKVESRVDCWGPKKQSTSEKNITEESSYKSKYLTGLKDKSDGSRMSDNPSVINQKRQKQSYRIKHQQWIQKQTGNDQEQYEEQISEKYPYQNHRNSQYQNEPQEVTYQSSYLKKLVQQRERGSFSYANGGKYIGQKKSEQKLTIKRQQPHIQQRFDNLTVNIQKRLSQLNTPNSNKQPSTQLKKPLQPQAKKPAQGHRPIQSLEEVYSTLYSQRLNNLKTKLNMLQSARYIQRDESIAVLLEDSRYVKKMYKDGQFSTLYWPQVRTMETAFLDYIKFSGF